MYQLICYHAMLEQCARFVCWDRLQTPQRTVRRSMEHQSEYVCTTSRRSEDHRSLRVNYWLYSSRVLLICHLEDLDLILTLKESLRYLRTPLRTVPSNQVCSVLMATCTTRVSRIFKSFSIVKIPNIFRIDFLIVFCLTKRFSLNNIVSLKRYFQKILSYLLRYDFLKRYC